MAADAFDDLLELEDEFYKEGYDAGVADSIRAGKIEGKIFGIEKGYEKALELGRLYGRACVWHQRTVQDNVVKSESENRLTPSDQLSHPEESRLVSIAACLEKLPDNVRLRKHIESLLSLTKPDTIVKDNSDEAVSEFDDRLSKARAKAKVITNLAGDSMDPALSNNPGIEDATGLTARH